MSDNDHRRTFVVPEGQEPVLDKDGRATGEIRPIDWKARAEAAEARVKELEGALEWYMEQVKTMSQFGAALTAALEGKN